MRRTASVTAQNMTVGIAGALALAGRRVDLVTAKVRVDAERCVRTDLHRLLWERRMPALRAMLPPVREMVAVTDTNAPGLPVRR
jgi:hypothetical protein